MAIIKRIWSREILDSRSTPTVETACLLDNGVVSVYSVPSGASTGSYESLELRDSDPNRFHGKGVLKAVNNVNQVLGPQIVSKNFDATNQFEIDQFMIKLDGTENKSKLGANAILSISGAVAKAAALSSAMQLFEYIADLARKKQILATVHAPIPLFNMINGGLHGAGNLDFQEFFVIPASSKSFTDGLRIGSEIYMSIGNNLKHRGAIHSVGDEGGYAPNLFTNADALEILVEAIRQTTYQLGRDIFLGLDVAASTFFADNMYTIRDKSAPFTEDSLIMYYKELQNNYHLAVLEDPLHEDAWEGWRKISEVLGSQVAIVGDDLLATNLKRVDKAIQNRACNAVLIKPNQIGTITETLDVIKKARDAGWKVIVSHRSGETNDSFIADFASGVGADYVKFGAPARGERVAKYNRLMSIESEIYLKSQPQAQR